MKNIISFILLACCSISQAVYAQNIQTQGIDTFGPAFNPASQQILDEYKNFQECGLTNINWLPGSPADSGQPEIVHKFDRLEDKDGVYELMKMSEYLSLEWKVEEAWERKNSLGLTNNNDWKAITNQIKFIPEENLSKLVRLGYLTQFAPKIKINANGTTKLEDMPNWNNMYYFPTACGTFVFIKYEPVCEEKLEPNYGDRGEAPLKLKRIARVSTEDPSDPDKQAKSYDLKRNSVYYLANFYPPTFSRDVIAEGFYFKKKQAYYTNWGNFLEFTQTIAEFHPVIGIVLPLLQSFESDWWEHKPLVKAADQADVAINVVLTSIPYLAQVSKLRGNSKYLFIAGSSALVGQLTAIKIRDQNDIKIEDMVRLVTLMILSMHVRNLHEADKVEDAKRIIVEASDSSGATQGFINLVTSVRRMPAFNEKLRKIVSTLFEPRFITVNQSVGPRLKNLVEFFKLHNLRHFGEERADKAISYFYYNLFTLDKVLDHFVDASRNIHINDRISQSLSQARVVLLNLMERMKAQDIVDPLTGAMIVAGKSTKIIQKPASEFPLNEFLRTVEKSRSAVLGEKGIKSLEELQTLGLDFIVDYESSVRKRLMKEMHSLFPEIKKESVYARHAAEIILVDIKRPTHYYIGKNSSGRSEYIPFSPGRGDFPPYKGPKGEEVKLIDELLKTKHGELYKLGEECLERETLLSWHEELQHAATDMHQVKSLRITDPDSNSLVDVRGAGFLLSRYDENGRLFPSMTLVAREESVNFLTWIRTMPVYELRELYKRLAPKDPKFPDLETFMKNATPTEMRDYVSRIEEADVWFSVHAKDPVDKIITAEDFTSGRYIARLFAEHYYNIGMPTTTPTVH